MRVIVNNNWIPWITWCDAGRPV